MVYVGKYSSIYKYFFRSIEMCEKISDLVTEEVKFKANSIDSWIEYTILI